MCTHEDGQDGNGHARLRTLTLPRPRCPRCGHALLKKYRSLRDQGDGTSLSWVRCLKCAERFRVLLE
jgi:hypothetical protein